MKIVWDLDGVLRDLEGYLAGKFDIPSITEWFWKHKGKDIFELVREDNYNALVYAPATEFERLAKYNFNELEIWTCQPDEWIPYTKLWIDNHFPGANVKYLTNQEKREWLDNEPDAFLIEDNPLFTNYDRILLVDQLYNRHIQNAVRIHNAKELNTWILSHLESSTTLTS